MSEIPDVILGMLAPLAPGKSIDPMDVAKTVQPERWQRLLPRVRAEAIMMAKAGAITILRNNKPANPSNFKGVWRIRLPLETDQTFD